jgi:hypothetical protein
VRVLALAILALALPACGPTQVQASRETLRLQAGQELACPDAQVVYYGLRGKDIGGDSACFGPTADKLAVVQCGQAQQRRAYWGFGDRWEPRPGEVTAVEADHVEISLAQGGSSLEAVARCGH